jgi:hypothetical protein
MASKTVSVSVPSFSPLLIVVALVAAGIGFFAGNSAGDSAGYTRGSSAGYTSGHSDGWGAGVEAAQQRTWVAGAKAGCFSVQEESGYDIFVYRYSDGYVEYEKWCGNPANFGSQTYPTIEYVAPGN